MSAHATHAAPDEAAAEPSLRQRQAELVAAIGDRKGWEPRSADTFFAVGRVDGHATVNANSGGFWLVRTGPGEKMMAELQPSAEAAVQAAEQINAAKKPGTDKAKVALVKKVTA